MDPITATALVVAACIAAIAPIFVAWDTRQNKKMLTTSNGTTTAQYAEQTHELVRILSRQMEDHMTREGLHYARS